MQNKPFKQFEPISFNHSIWLGREQTSSFLSFSFFLLNLQEQSFACVVIDTNIWVSHYILDLFISITLEKLPLYLFKLPKQARNLFFLQFQLITNVEVHPSFIHACILIVHLALHSQQGLIVRVFICLGSRRRWSVRKLYFKVSTSFNFPHMLLLSVDPANRIQS